jgi:hypothetical protein
MGISRKSKIFVYLNHTGLNQSYLEVTGSTCAELGAFYTYNIF